MKFSMPTLVICCLLIFSCNQDSLLTSSQEEKNNSYFNIEDHASYSAMKNKDKKKPLKVFRTSSNITIDGQESEWSEVPKHKMRVEIDLGFELDDKYDLSSYFKMLWDDENLYVFAKILDEEINTSGGQLFEKDGFEVYIDGNNSKTQADYNLQTFPPAAYGNNTDFFRFIPGENQALGAWGIIDASSFETEISLTNDGYNVETKIPFITFSDFPAVAGHQFGLELQVNDNDNDERQQLLKWWSDIDFSFLDPSLFGTAELFHAVAE